MIDLDSSDSSMNCFVICPIGSKGSATRKRSDDIFHCVITPAVEKHGYHPIRSDKISQPGRITAQILSHLCNDGLVIADLTDQNPNVFYELALRHAVGKPVIILCEEGQELPFDTYDVRTVFIKHDDLSSAKKGEHAISEQIEFISENPRMTDNPVSTSIRIEELRRTDNPHDDIGAKVISMLEEIRSRLADIQRESDVHPEDSEILKKLSAFQLRLRMFQAQLLKLQNHRIPEEFLSGIYSSYNQVIISLGDMIGEFPDIPRTYSLLGAVKQLLILSYGSKYVSITSDDTRLTDGSELIDIPDE